LPFKAMLPTFATNGDPEIVVSEPFGATANPATLFAEAPDGVNET
jgi:hypothetical protein